MSRHQILIVKETHRGLLYEDGILREVLPAGRYRIPPPPSRLGEYFGAGAPRVEVVLIDVRSRNRTVVVQDLVTADCATISASFIVHFRVTDPRAAVHLVKDFEERLYLDAQTAARRILRGLSLGEVIGGRDEIGEELEIQLRESAAAYGLEVSTLDFKDLLLPEALRQALNRAAVVKRLRQFPIAEARADDLEVDGMASTTDDLNSEPEEADVVLARMAFDRQAEPRDGGPPLGPHGHEPRLGTPPPGGFEGLRRFRP
jgi:regulator of protease activity HflC (stomatin/prohibitin superfamily)